MGHALGGHRERGVLPVIGIPYLGTEQAVDGEGGKEGLRHVSDIRRAVRKISRFRGRSLTVNKTRRGNRT